MVTTRRATARARGEDEPRKRYAELEDLEAEDLEEGERSNYRLSLIF